MTVYLDDANIIWRGKLWCHLYADSLAELERFARKAALAPSWLQHADGEDGLPHYDVTGNKIKNCIRMGATPVTKGDGNYRRLRQMLTRGEYPMEVT